MFEFFVSGLRSGIRGRSLQVVFVLGVLTVFVAYLSGSFSPRQPRTVVMDIGFSGLRFVLVFLNLLWVQELVVREIERRTVFLSLTYPVSRGSFLIGRFLAVALLSGLAVVILGCLLSLAVAFAGGGYDQIISPSLGLPFWMTLVGLTLDAAVVAGFALWVSAVSTVSTLPLALGAAFAIAGKALGPTLDYLAAGGDGDVVLVARFGPVVDGIRWLVPDLSRLDWRDWPLYLNSPSDAALLWACVMAASYLALSLSLAIALFGRREFS